MKNKTFIIAAVISLFAFSSCEKVTGEGPVITETRPVNGFKKISVSISGKVNYYISPDYSIQIQAQQNILDILQTNKVGDELVLKFQDGKRVRSHEDIIVNIHAPYAEGVNLSGSGEFNLWSMVRAEDMKLRISGSGNIFISDIDLSDELEANVSGSGNIIVNNGNTKRESLRISGSGNIRTANVFAETATTEISGSGDIELRAQKKIDATISGSGSVFYKGNPVILTKISGSGKVVPF